MDPLDQAGQRARLETLGRLTAFAVHDLNNLLMLIDGYAHLLLEEDLSPSARETAGEILRAQERAAQLTTQLLGVVRNRPAEPAPLDLRAALSAAAPLLARILGESIQLHWDAPAGLGFRTVPGKLEQLLLNLAVNAREAMPAGGDFTIRASAAATGIVLEVADTGPGIAPEWQRKIFEPFFTTKPDGQGTGVGLALVAEIVAEWGGQIQVVNQPGACFRILIPQPEIHPATILLVEDEPALRSLMARTLRQAGHTVLEAESAAAALAASGSPHLLITDLQLRDAAGDQLAQALCARLPGLKVLIISGQPLDGTGLAENFLQKPFSANNLVLGVHKLLQAL
jgi:CheY-like chemotaxis protein